MIRTPDQRVRVFVSSTLQELAEERMVVKQAIEDLKLIPVMFELGAKAHPPRQLYLSYLEQSDIFIGIYWKSYGWIAETMEISGLEDEFRLSLSKPQLIYIKYSDERQPRLSEMILQIQKQGDISYKSFHDTTELKNYITNDLASLLSERFLDVRGSSLLEKKLFFNTIPVPFHDILGREKEIQEVIDLMIKKNKRLVSLTGMGGTGKSRLAIEIGTKLISQFKQGVCFISLASIKDYTLVETCIATALGISDSSKQALKETILSYLSDKNLMLVLDNFEHVLPGASIASEILSRSHEVFILVTSRSPLNLRAEYHYPLAPLALKGSQPILESEALAIPALNLFIERANSINSRIDWNEENLLAVKKICECLGGLPLAIELAAMRVKHTTPSVLWKGMQKSLDILTSGAVDLPGRQRSFRATLDWSYQLLSFNDQQVFKISSLFQNGWYLDALAQTGNLPIDECQSSVERLIDAGLIVLKSIDRFNVRYDKLQPIDEYADELFAQDALANEWKELFSIYYVQTATKIQPTALRVRYSAEWLPWINAEYENLRTAFQYCIKRNNLHGAYHIIHAMGTFWMYIGSQNEGLRWIKEAGINAETVVENFTPKEIFIYANCLMFSGMFKFFQADFPTARLELNKAKMLFASVADDPGVARSNIYLAMIGLSTFNLDSIKLFDEALSIGERCNDFYSIFLAITFKAEYFCLVGDLIMAKEQINQAEKRLTQQPHGNDFDSVEDLHPLFYLEKGNVYLVSGDLETASEAFNVSIKLYEEKSLKTSLGYAFEGLAMVNALKGEIPTACTIALKGLNVAREQGDVIMILVHLKLLLGLLIANNKGGTVTGLLDEVNTHFNLIKYRSWSVDSLSSTWIKDIMITKNILYTFKEKPEPMSMDDLLHTVLNLYKT